MRIFGAVGRGGKGRIEDRGGRWFCILEKFQEEAGRQMKTILMITPFAKPNIGGVESHIEKLTAYLSATGHRVILVTYQPLTTKARGKGYEKSGGVEVYRARWFGNGWFTRLEPYFPLVFLYLFPGLFVKSLIVCMKRHREIDVIHAHGLVAATIAKILCFVFRKRGVVSTHAIYSFRNRKLLAALVKWILKGFDAILAVGEPSRMELIEMGLDGEKIKVHPNWIDMKTFTVMDREKCRKDFKIEPKEFTALFIGRLMEMKGLNLLLDAAEKTEKDILFMIAGDGPMAEAVKKAAKKNGKIKFYGRLSDSAVIKAYNAADIFVSPVLYDEGFATVYIEALACGTPVVTARRGCLPYFLSTDVADLLEEVDAEAVRRTLEYYFDNRDIVSQKRAVCRRFAKKNFSENNARVIAESY